MYPNSKRRTILALIAGSLVTAACGGGGSETTDANPLTAKDKSATVNASLLSVTAPAAGASVPVTFKVTGLSGSSWVNVAVWDHATATKVGPDTAPSGGTFSIPVNLGALTGTRQLDVIAFSVPAGQSGGTSTTLSAKVTVAAQKLFYGANGHIQQGSGGSWSAQLADLKALHATVYRNDVSGLAAATQLATAAAVISAPGTGVMTYPVLTPSPFAAATEADAYADGFTLGQQVATARKYPYYEVGNEFENTVVINNASGMTGTDYDNSMFQLCRGSIRGMIAGIKSIDPVGKIIMCAGGWLHIAFYQMLAAGTQPDGTGGHPTITWDITAWHWYDNFGDITNVMGVNVLATLQSAFGKPIWLTEVGVRPGPSDTQVGTSLITLMAQYQSIAATYGIQSLSVYELYDSSDGYGLVSNSEIRKTDFSTVANWIAAHPMS